MCYTHPVGEFCATVVALWQVKNSVVVSMAAVKEGADVLYMVLVANLNWLCWIGHYWKGNAVFKSFYTYLVQLSKNNIYANIEQIFFLCFWPDVCKKVIHIQEKLLMVES